MYLHDTIETEGAFGIAQLTVRHQVVRSVMFLKA
jgi:hypothetical protein